MRPAAAADFVPVKNPQVLVANRNCAPPTARSKEGRVCRRNRAAAWHKGGLAVLTALELEELCGGETRDDGGRSLRMTLACKIGRAGIAGYCRQQIRPRIGGVVLPDLKDLFHRCLPKPLIHKWPSSVLHECDGWAIAAAVAGGNLRLKRLHEIGKADVLHVQV